MGFFAAKQSLDRCVHGFSLNYIMKQSTQFFLMKIKVIYSFYNVVFHSELVAVTSDAIGLELIANS